MDNSQPPVTENIEEPPMGFSPESPGAGVPPTMPGELPQLAPKTTWPVVLGIMAILFGSFGALGSLAQIISPFLIDAVGANAQGDANQKQMLEAMAHWKFYLAFAGVGSLALSILLFVCGLKLLHRRRAVGVLIVKWSVVKILWSMIAVAITFGMQQEQFAAMAQTTQGMPGAIAGVIAILSAILGLLFAWAFPIFMLIWMRRATIVAEIEQWS